MVNTNKGEFVEIQFIGKANGEVFDTNIPEELKKINPNADARKTIVSIGHGMVVEGLDKALEGKEIGKDYEITIPSAEAYGPRRRDMVKLMPLKAFTEKQVYPQAGMVLTLDDMLVKVIAVSGARVSVDFNNPLAGKDLHYKFKIVRKVENDEEKSRALFEIMFKFIPEFTTGDKITIKGPKFMEAFVKAYGPKFKEIVGKELAFELKEMKKDDKKEEEKIKKVPLKMPDKKLKDKVVLVFDDDYGNVAMCTARNLERTLGCTCLNYNRAQECLEEIIHGMKFDLFLVDMGVDLGNFKERIGDLTGYHLGKLVSESRPNVTIISISGYDHKPDYACVHLTKPCHPERIEEEVRKHLEV